MSEYLAGVVQNCLDDNVLKEAFELFDADHDGKINLEEFEFFMNGFAKDMNKLKEAKLVKDMIAESSKHADGDQLFEITTLVKLLK
jgi:Ca2+-binding EF-hand superfamily protein